ncbi:hypothetical protein AX16_004390 [Volvariella volvacea WC 439]|nr:hypothetical protein AX16_004390 [Volvariella volvacea WC 439]
MARFRAYTTDSSDDEETTPNYQRQDSEEQEAEDSDVLREEEALVEGELTEEEVEIDEYGSEEEDGVESRARSRSKNALVTDEDGEYQYAHEIGSRSSSAPSQLSSQSPPPRARGDPSLIPWAQHVGVDAQKMHVMQTSFFRMPEEAAAIRAVNKATATRSRPAIRLPSHRPSRKHSRDSEGDGMRVDSRERASFAHDIEPPQYRPSRKYARVEATLSAVNGHEGALVDAGLSLGRSFRVGWGPGGKFVHLGGLCDPLSSSKSTANSSSIRITTFPPLSPLALCPAPNSPSATPANQGNSLPSLLLQHHLTNTPISPDESNVPAAQPSQKLNFASFASLLPPNSTSPVASLFRLGRALFDPINTRLPPRSAQSSITPMIRNRIDALLRTQALSEFLTDTLAPTVESLLRSPSSSPLLPTSAVPTFGSTSSVSPIFTLLTGNQVSRACDKAAEAGYPKLATLIAQAGGDEALQMDVRLQLNIWKQEGLTSTSTTSLGSKSKPLVSEEVQKIYELLGGGFFDDSAGDLALNVLQGLDWKRVFGVCLWYGPGGAIDKTVGNIFNVYEALVKRDNLQKVARPLPWYYEGGNQKTQQTPWKLPPHTASSLIHDAHYTLLRMHADPALPLSQLLTPLSFSPSPIDWSMCWHLYIILSRSMRIRDFADRGESLSHKGLRLPNGSGNGSAREGDVPPKVEGHSPSADLLASMYALQLEAAGMIQEAAFVLLHIEGSIGREKAIKDLLGRSARLLDEWMTRGLVGSLRLPMAWVNEAKAVYAISNGQIFQAYELYLAAGSYNAAHELAVLELAPDAVVRKDFELLRTLFEKFEGREVDGWYVKGKVFLDYAHIMTRLPELHDEQAENAVFGATHATEIEELTRKVPKIIGLLPDILQKKGDLRHKAALSEMTRSLVSLINRVKPLALQTPILGTLVDERTKLAHTRSFAYARFAKSL